VFSQGSVGSSPTLGTKSIQKKEEIIMDQVILFVLINSILGFLSGLLSIHLRNMSRDGYDFLHYPEKFSITTKFSVFLLHPIFSFFCDHGVIYPIINLDRSTYLRLLTIIGIVPRIILSLIGYLIILATIIGMVIYGIFTVKIPDFYHSLKEPAK
jgi:hypothetical protein